MAEIIDVERFGVDLVHGACGVCHSCHFVGVIFLPPLERSRDIHGDEDLADKLSMVTSRHAETLREVEIVRSEDEISVLIIAAVHTSPAVQRVSRVSAEADDIVVFHFVLRSTGTRRSPFFFFRIPIIMNFSVIASFQLVYTKKSRYNENASGGVDGARKHRTAFSPDFNQGENTL